MAGMTVTTMQRQIRTVVFDLYRDVHKGIRAELFAVTQQAGSADASLADDRAALAAHVEDVAAMLVAHAEHEEEIQPALEAHIPSLAEQVDADHEALEAHLRELTAFAGAAEDRGDLHHLHLELAAFTGAYLAHQDVEERVVMPALETAIGVEAVLGIHEAIVAGIPPDRFVRFLAVMLPAMNVDDRTELLGGLQANAPAALFQQTWSVARSVLPDADVTTVAGRLGLS